MYISWLRSSKIHTSSNSCVRNRNSDFPWKQRRLPVVCLKKRPEWKQKSPTPVTMFITLVKQKISRHFEKKSAYMTTHSPAPLKSLSRRVFASLLAPPLHGAHWLLAPVGFANRWKWWWDIWMVFWYIQELHVFLLITIPCSLVPLPNYIWQESKKDGSKSRWHLLRCYGDVLGGMERFGAILDSRDDILESFAIGALDASHVHVWLFDGSLWVGSKSLGFPKSKTNLEMIHFMADVEWTRSNNP